MDSTSTPPNSAPSLDLRSLPPTELARLEASLKDGWRLTPATFGHKVTEGRWIPARHLTYISTILATEIAKGDARIIMTMPARHGKSELISVNTPGWFLERWPDRYVMTISYGSELATDFSLKVRDMFQDEDLHELLRTRIRRDKKRVDRWLTAYADGRNAGGGLTAAGIGGPLTGRGADLMIIDDYVKNAEEALSETNKKATWEWFKSTAYTRLEPGASLVILATRWAKDDLIGQCLKEMPHENWLVINLPALAEANDPLGREPGEALWPQRYTAKRLNAIRQSIGRYWWKAMYQQDPLASMAGADIGDKLVAINPSDVPDDLHNCKQVRAWDFAGTDGKVNPDADWSAGPLMLFHKGTKDVIITDMQRFQKSPYGRDLMVKEVARLDGHGVKIWAEQEPGSSGVTVVEHHKAMLAGYSFDAERATGPLEVRAGPFLAACEAGKVKIVKAPWNKALREELNAFPDGSHDDQIIACALAYNKLVRAQSTSLTWGRDTPGGNVIPLSQSRYMREEHQDKSPGEVIRGVIW